MEIAPNYLELSLWPFRYRFDRATIVALVLKQSLWTTYLRIIHRNPKYERFALFLPLEGMERLEAALSSNGYRIEDGRMVSEPDDVTFARGITNAAWAAVVAALLAGIAAVVVSFYAVSR